MKNKTKKLSITLSIIAIIMAGFYFSKNSSSPSKPVVKTQEAAPLEEKRDEVKDKSITSTKAKTTTVTEVPRKKPESIHQLASLYTKVELELMSETSKLKMDPKLVDQFIEKSKNTKNNQELVNLAKEIGKNNLPLQLQLVKYANTKFPPAKVQKSSPQGELIKADHLFKKLKKN